MNQVGGIIFQCSHITTQPALAFSPNTSPTRRCAMHHWLWDLDWPHWLTTVVTVSCKKTTEKQLEESLWVIKTTNYFLWWIFWASLFFSSYQWWRENSGGFPSSSYHFRQGCWDQCSEVIISTLSWQQIHIRWADTIVTHRIHGTDGIFTY